MAGLARLDRRPHEQADGGLVERVGPDSGLGVPSGRVEAADGELGAGRDVAGAAQERPVLVAGGAHPLGVRFVGEDAVTGEQLQRPAPGGRGQGRRTGGELALALGRQPSGLVDVDLHVAKAVALTTTDDHRGAERRAQPGDQRRHVLRRSAWRAVRPQRFDDAVGGDQLPPTRGQERHEPPRLAAAQAWRGADAASGPTRRTSSAPTRRTATPATAAG